MTCERLNAPGNPASRFGLAVAKKLIAASLLAGAACPVWAAESEILNPGFETGTLAPWTPIGPVEAVKKDSHAGSWCLRIGTGSGGEAQQKIAVKPGSIYRVSGWLRNSSGADVVELGVKDYGGERRAVGTASVSWAKVNLVFETGPKATTATLFAQSPAESWMDDAALEYLGPSSGMTEEAIDGNSIRLPQKRVPKTDMGITQLSNERMDWLLKARFGMFIHWGLYAGMGKGEWRMYKQPILPEEYRKLAYPESGEEYFAADQYNPAAWAKLAKEAGMRWMCLTTRHHDGYNLFDVPHPNAFTSMQTHHRDFVAEYVKAVRAEGLGVGLYFSPLNWRYPGYFDVTGTSCLKNNFGYVTDPSHYENARIMKEENYAAVKQLMTAYGHIDHIYWDGGWLGLHGSDADGAYFHESGRYLDPANPWPIGKAYQTIEPETGKALGIMGIVRHFQPDAITNPRYGWMGDICEEEGPAPITGPIRSAQLYDKNLSAHRGGWGYVPNPKVMSRDAIIRMLADCVVRNMTMLLNVGPDRHGVIPPQEQDRLREVGAWLRKAAPAIYDTRGGPWNPKDGRYGFCRKGNTIFVHLFEDQKGDSFTLPPVGPLVPQKAWEVLTGKELKFRQDENRTVIIEGIDRGVSPADTIVAVRFDQDVLSHALPARELE